FISETSRMRGAPMGGAFFFDERRPTVKTGKSEGCPSAIRFALHTIMLVYNFQWVNHLFSWFRG
ncbi:MAG: hypothetical protein VYE64_10335, partial [Planctomycetota bacterium]|nr:hypothetical protein [Planctomycetota bacterium]